MYQCINGFPTKCNKGGLNSSTNEFEAYLNSQENIAESSNAAIFCSLVDTFDDALDKIEELGHLKLPSIELLY